VNHEVDVEPGSRLAQILGSGRMTVVSWHHQAIDRVAGELRVVARSQDGVPEAVEMQGTGWVFGVQWHPELNAHACSRQAALFRGVVDAAQRYGRSKT
jgi:putative glutamine amidotransferase